MPSIFLVYQDLAKYSQKIILVEGWVKSIRQSKEIVFLTLNDGSTTENLQIIFRSPNFTQWEQLEKVNFASSLRIRGKLNSTPQREQACELEAHEIIFANPADGSYPFQKKSLPLEIVRNYPHLRAKTNYFLTMFRLRSIVSSLIHQFFQAEGFYHIHTPLITSNDSEGAGELFTLITSNENKEKFFAKSAKLTVSGQLQAEALAQGLGKVYTFSPCFRAEKSNTTRHLAEFWMIEPEMAFTGLAEIIILSERMLKYIINQLITNNYKELEYFEKYNEKTIIAKLKNIATWPFQKITYTEAIELLIKVKEKFIYKDIQWGMDLQSEHEKYLAQHFNKPVFVTNYPASLKSFYMKNNEDGKTVDCLDLLLPEIGELIGGSAREDNYQALAKKVAKNGLNLENLAWYLDLRKTGYAPSAGFGLGFERLLMLLTGTENIRDTIPFPRHPKHLEF